jgi:glutathionylspermidine synthase
MKRKTIAPRDGWEKKVEDVGLVFHSPDGPYWNEAAYYEFTSAEVDMLEKTTNRPPTTCTPCAWTRCSS